MTCLECVSCSSASTMVKYYYHGGKRVAMRVGSALYYLFSDHLGSSSVSLRASDSNTLTQRYYPWGTIRPGPDNGLPTDYTFTGQKLDTSTGLLYYVARYYDPALGRFIQADPVVPGTTAHATSSPAAVGYDDQSLLTVLTVGFIDTEFISLVAEENRETLEKGFWFQRGETEKSKSKYPWGPQNPQGLSRYSYVLNNPVRYQDPSGFQPQPPEWLQTLKVVWRNPPDWVRNLLFDAGKGTRLIQINAPHAGADYWHINTDLKLLRSVNHTNVESLLAQAATAKACVESIIGYVTEAEWISILEKIPPILLPRFLIDPTFWFLDPQEVITS